MKPENVKLVLDVERYSKGFPFEGQPISGTGRVVMLFFAGHGVNRIGDQNGYFFLTSDVDPSALNASAISATISGEDIKKVLAEIPASKQIVILDTCHSGAATNSLLASRNVSGEYQRAWESIRDTTGTWMLAGAASDQLSYESGNVEHGLLTYSLLEALDKAPASALRQTPSGELFVDIERWLSYAANRVESLKQEVGIKGIQKPQFRRSTRGSTFDIGVMKPERRGFLGLMNPLPVVIVGSFDQDEEDPLKLEQALGTVLKQSKKVKAWFDEAKHPSVYRTAGTYQVQGEQVTVRCAIQTFDAEQNRKTVATVEVIGKASDVAALALQVREQIESKILELEAAKTAAKE